VPTELLISRSAGRTATALRENGVTVEIRVEDDGAPLAVGAVVKGRVSKILPGIQSAFLSVGDERDAFLHAADLLLPEEAPPAGTEADEASDPDAEFERSADRPSRRASSGPPIEQRLREGRELLVQVAREALGAKGPRVTSFVTLAGRYLVHSPRLPHRGVSRRIVDPEARARLRRMAASLPAPQGGFIVRTAGAAASPEAFEADARALVRTWSGVEARAAAARTPSVVHADLGLFLRTLRDLTTEEVDRIVVDDDALLEEGRDYLRELDAVLAAKLSRHTGAGSLFDAHGVTADIDKALRPRVWLRSGGTLVIEPTEALVSIDVNTGKFVGSRRQEDTVLRTNLEAAEEIARQLRLRDLGGIIVVDFIDMVSAEHRRQVIDALALALRRDRARTKIAGLSELGLLQLTRKRTRPGIAAALTRACDACSGTGRVKTPETVAHEALDEARRVAAAMGEQEVVVRAHPEVARAARLQSQAERGTGALAGRLRIVEDPGGPIDRFDVVAG